MPKDAGHLTTAKVGEIAHRLLMTGDDKILAAATLRALAEERDRLREALAKIAAIPTADVTAGESISEAVNVARAALGE